MDCHIYLVVGGFDVRRAKILVEMGPGFHTSASFLGPVASSILLCAIDVSFGNGPAIRS